MSMATDIVSSHRRATPGKADRTMASKTAFAHYERSLVNFNNLRVASQEADVRKAEAAYDAVKTSPEHTYEQKKAAGLRMADARLALWRA
jgi:hypothetical protein